MGKWTRFQIKLSEVQHLPTLRFREGGQRSRIRDEIGNWLRVGKKPTRSLKESVWEYVTCVVSIQPSAVSCQPSAVSRQLSAVSCQVVVIVGWANRQDSR
ncbi:hypothetical protein [Moorena producens]|uniref:hypothetical protein n=1 Tax=Moorena producens TaxID=1155739 RepID=UPI003C78B1CC